MDSPSKHVFDHILFSAELGRQFSCCVCKNPFLDAEIATPCGHSFCGFCVDHFRADGKANCQMCQQPIVAYTKNRLANDMLATINGQCTWCQQELPLDTAKQHVRRCHQIQVPCDLCKQPFKRKYLQNHLQECIFRDVICLCGMRLKKKDEEEHVRTACTFREEPCPLNCGDSVKRYLIPSHTLQCPQVVTFCSVKGCSKIVKKRDLEDHIKEDQMRHFSLLTEEKKNILWEVERKVSVTDVHVKCTGEVAIFEWSVPAPSTGTSGLRSSPPLDKFNRKWCLLLTNQAICLQYNQGVHPIHMDVSFTIEMADGRQEIHLLRGVELHEGTEVKHQLKVPTRSIRKVVAKMEILEPELLS